MNTHDFIASLRPYSDQTLIFEHLHGARVPAGYHVTEVKAVRYQTMDCGGEPNAWAETIVQLWNPEEGDEARFMTVEKFLKIYDRAAGGTPVQSDAEIRLEYGNETLPATNFLVGEITPTHEGVIVQLEAPTVTCKARDRRLAREKLPSFEMIAPTAQSCSPSADGETSSCCS
jgi:Family of unknown function (DUF6428)